VNPRSELRFILDASAVLAYLQRERGYPRVSSALANGAGISAVNLAEVYAKLIERGLPAQEVGARLKSLGLKVLPFDEDDALESAALYQQARRLGPVPGRSCLRCFGSAPSVAGINRRPGLDTDAGCQCPIDKIAADSPVL
jgi:ribonuclease VapC